MRYLEFLKRQFLLAHIGGIPVRIDYRWFFVLAFMTWLTANSITILIENTAAALLLGFVVTLVFFASILFHELAHAVVARMEGVGVLEIVLHPFGGLARFNREPDTPRAEFRIAIAGPAASFLLGLFFLALVGIFNSIGSKVLTLLLFLLFFGNMLLAIFNLFPGYPLDGGRVLRAYLWRRGKDLNEATILTGRFGQIIAVVLIVFGFFAAIVRGDNLTGLWTLLVGFFLLDAATEIIRHINGFENLTIKEVMQLPISVAPETTILEFVDRTLTVHRKNIFPVAKNKQFFGVLMLEDMKKLPREEWQKTTIQTIMRPVTPDYFIESDSYLKEAQELMRENGIGALGVIDKAGNLVGFLQRGRIRKRN